MHTCNPSSQKAEAGGWRLWDQPPWHNKIVSETNKQNPKKIPAKTWQKKCLNPSSTTIISIPHITTTNQCESEQGTWQLSRLFSILWSLLYSCQTALVHMLFATSVVGINYLVSVYPNFFTCKTDTVKNCWMRKNACSI